MKPLLPLLAALLAGCAPLRQRRLADEQVRCVYRALYDPGFSGQDRAFLAKSCHSVYLILGGNP